MNKMVDEYYNGAEIVYGVRSKRDTDTFFKRVTAESFYMNRRFIFLRTEEILLNVKQERGIFNE